MTALGAIAKAAGLVGLVLLVLLIGIYIAILRLNSRAHIKGETETPDRVSGGT